MWIVSDSIYKHEKKYLKLDVSGARSLPKTKSNWTVVLHTDLHHTLLNFPPGNLSVFLVCSWGCWYDPTFAEKALVTWGPVEVTQVSGSNQDKPVGWGGGFICLSARAASLS